MIKENTPEAKPSNKGETKTNIDNNVPIVLKTIFFGDIPDSFSGDIGIKETPVYRMYKCEKCKGSFKRSQGVLLLFGFFCKDDNPYKNNGRKHKGV